MVLTSALCIDSAALKQDLALQRLASQTWVPFWIYPVKGMACESSGWETGEYVLPKPDDYILCIHCGPFILHG